MSNVESTICTMIALCAVVELQTNKTKEFRYLEQNNYNMQTIYFTKMIKFIYEE